MEMVFGCATTYALTKLLPDQIDTNGLFLQNKYMIRSQVNYLGTYVADIAAHCGNGVYAGGQEFDTDHYNILARHGCDLFTYNI